MSFLFEEVLETEGEHQKSKTVILTFSENASVRVFRFVISKHGFSVFNICVLIRFPPNSLLGFNPNIFAMFLSEAGSLISSSLTDAVNTFMIILESSFLFSFDFPINVCGLQRTFSAGLNSECFTNFFGHCWRRLYVGQLSTCH